MSFVPIFKIMKKDLMSLLECTNRVLIIHNAHCTPLMRIQSNEHEGGSGVWARGRRGGAWGGRKSPMV